MTTTPAARDERKPVIHQAFIFSDNPRLQAILPQGAIICGPEPVEVVLASDYALAESELAEVREQRDRYMASLERKHKLMDEDAATIAGLRADLERVNSPKPSPICTDDPEFITPSNASRGVEG